MYNIAHSYNAVTIRSLQSILILYGKPFDQHFCCPSPTHEITTFFIITLCLYILHISEIVEINTTYTSQGNVCGYILHYRKKTLGTE